MGIGRPFEAGWLRAGRLAGALVLVLPALAALAEIRVANYNLLQFDSNASSRYPYFRTVLSAMNPDIVVVQEIANQAAVDAFRDQVLNGNGGPGGFSAATFTNTSSNLDQALFYRGARFSEVTAGYAIIPPVTPPASSPRDAYRWRIRPTEDPSGNNDIYIYSMHLHSTDPALRQAQATDVRNNADALPTGAFIIYAGDLNLQSSSEGAYEQLTGTPDSVGRGFDPISMPGAWSSNSSFRHIHTQSPHQDNDTPESPAPPGGVGGGLDDRFDFLLISAPLRDGVGVDYITGTYRAFGNDGEHYNADINDPPVIPEGIAVANALHAASDHLPVVMHLLDPSGPPQIGTIPPVNFGVVLMGAAPVQAVIQVQNTAYPPALDLEYSFSAPAGFTAPAGTFTEPAGGGANSHTLTMLTTTSGNKFGYLEVPNNSINAPNRQVPLSGGVMEHAKPSTEATSRVFTAPLGFGTHFAGQFTDQTARVYNANVGVPAGLTVPLKVYAATFTSNPSGRFSTVGFAVTGGITVGNFAAFTVRFNDAGAPAGPYSATLRFSSVDDSTLPGASYLENIFFEVSAVVSDRLRGDFDANGVVELADVPPFVTVLLDPAAASEADRWTADMDEDGENAGLDIQPLVDALLN